jgi:hypothetical protein
MKYSILFFCTLCFCTATFAATPTSASVEKLLAVTEVEKLLESVQQQVDGMLKNTMEQATQGETVSPAEQKILDTFRQKSVATINDQISFDKLKAIYVQIYSESFSQEEIDQLIAFYESPTGKMFVAKMPLVMQKTMAVMQQQMAPMLKSIQQSAKEMKEQLDALKQKPGK